MFASHYSFDTTLREAAVNSVLDQRQFITFYTRFITFLSWLSVTFALVFSPYIFKEVYGGNTRA